MEAEADTKVPVTAAAVRAAAARVRVGGAARVGVARVEVAAARAEAAGGAMIGVTARVAAAVNLLADVTLMAARLVAQPVAEVQVQAVVVLQLMRLEAVRLAA